MTNKVLKIDAALSALHKKQNIPENEYLNFVEQMQILMQKRGRARETEEHDKAVLRDFLKSTFYKNYEINTKERIDYAIFNGKSDKDSVGVIIEMKNTLFKPDMPKADNLNKKAFHQSVLYFLRERVHHKNNDIKHIIITNMYDWFVFDASEFEKHFYNNKKLIKEFTDWESGQKTSSNTELFYKEIAPKYLPDSGMVFTHFLLNFAPIPYTANNEPYRPMVYLYKLFSPEHLLKKPFANDSNSLNKSFYYELLYILGLEEHKVKGKKLISRPPEGKRITGSMIENTITTIETRNRLSKLNRPAKYGETPQEQSEAIALELNISWLNRILFLKLLEAQLIHYHKGDSDYKFLAYAKISEFDMLEELFFDVLAVEEDKRNKYATENFGHIPYLNSSLFEQTPLEEDVVSMSMLKDRYKIPLYKQTVLKTEGKRATGEMPVLEYLFAFLDAYDFSSEGKEEVQKETKELINASVLGLIFEKINGYKEGSFFTPGFITEFMSRETIQRAIVQKFKETAHSGHDPKSHSEFDIFQDIKTFKELKFQIKRFLSSDTIFEFNKIVNSVKIVDPAVGSGHFLVSALNEMLAVKSDLGILADAEGMPLDYSLTIENDELVARHRTTNQLFDYHLAYSGRDSKSHPELVPELQKVQETLFREKRIIIENCLFGVDINPNSAKITRLRLWIELLKNAYYTDSGRDSKSHTKYRLQTLPNIDINIKVGNSLISRFGLEANLRKTLRGTRWNVESYLNAVQSYKEVSDKKAKADLRRLIDDIKGNFRTVLRADNPKYIQLNKLKNKFYDLFSGNMLFEPEVRYGGRKTERERKRETMETEIKKLETEIEEVKNNKLYWNAFEWRFEFPEVLDLKTGDFLGFDVVMGNPPYIRQEDYKEIKPHLKENFEVFSGTADVLIYFIELGIKLLKHNGTFNNIISNKFMRAGFGVALRKWLKNYQINRIIDFGDLPVFAEATTYPLILSALKQNTTNDFRACNVKTLDFKNLSEYIQKNEFIVSQEKLSSESWILSNKYKQSLIGKIKNNGIPLKEIVNGKIFYGIKTGLNEAFVIDEATKNKLIKKDPQSAEIIKPFLAGKDIKRYKQPHSNKYLILTRKGVEIEKYPAVFSHLTKFKSKLQKKAGSAKWYELQANPASIDRFLATKILYQEIATYSSFTIDYESYFVNNKVFLINLDNLSLLGFLNSKLNWFYLNETASKLQGGALAMQSPYVLSIPVKDKILKNKSIKDRVTKILTLKKSNAEADTSSLEQEINNIVYALYGLTKQEVKLIEESTK